MKSILLCIFFIHISLAKAQPVGYSYGKIITFQASQISGSSALTNFTALISVVDNDLRTIANGGHVQNSNGYDIIFMEANCTDTLFHQIEKYNPVTGELVVWVLIPSLSSTINSDIHMYYGNSSISMNNSSTSTWSSTTAAVYHLSNSIFTDGSPNGMNAVNFSTTNVSGKIGDGRGFNGSSQYLNIVDYAGSSLDVTTVTMSAWVRPTNYNVVSDRGMIMNKENTYEAGLQDNVGALQAASQPGCWRWAGTGIAPLNTWSHIAVVFAAGIQKNYLNGVLIDTYTNCSNPLTLNNNALRIGARGGNGTATSFFFGDIDEAKISNVELTADWIATEYNNQNSPSTFYSISAENAASAICTPLPISLLYFNCTEGTNRIGLIDWKTNSELNNDYFTVEKSTDAKTWRSVYQIKGAGNSSVENYYQFKDTEIPQSLTTVYYRLKQTDFDGSFVYYGPESIHFNSVVDESEILVYPNPSSEKMTVTFENNSYTTDNNILIYSIAGKNLTQLTEFSVFNGGIEIDISQLKSGIYLLKIRNRTVRFAKVD